MASFTCSGVMETHSNMASGVMETHSNMASGVMETHSNMASGVMETHSNMASGVMETLGRSFKYPQYSYPSERVKSFRSFPSDKEQTHEDLAQAGFFYAGMQDCTRCFYCGGGLRNWLPGDVPIVEHARWFSECAYVRKQKGSDFVDNISITHPRQEEIAEDGEQANVTEKPVDYGEMVDSVLRKPCGAALEALNISLELRKSAVTKVLNDAGWDDSKVTSTMLALAALELKDDLDTVSVNTEPTKNNSVKEGFDVVDGAQPEPAMNNLNTDVESLRILEENKQLRSAMKCKVCMEAEVSIAFLPCGHLVTCSQCYSQLRTCVLCRAKIVASVKTFIS